MSYLIVRWNRSGKSFLSVVTLHLIPAYVDVLRWSFPERRPATP